MALAKYIRVDSSGNFLEVVAIDESQGAADAGKIPALDTAGLIPLSMIPSNLGVAVYEVQASENISAGDFVNIWMDNGDRRVRRADASAGPGFQAHGYVNAGVSLGETAQILTDFRNTGYSGLTPGSSLFLSHTDPGRATTTVPEDTGHIVQYLGVATNTGEIDVEIARPITRA